MGRELTDQEIDVLLEKFDKAGPTVQRRVAAKLAMDRELLLAAMKAIIALGRDLSDGDLCEIGHCEPMRPASERGVMYCHARQIAKEFIAKTEGEG